MPTGIATTIVEKDSILYKVCSVCKELKPLSTFRITSKTIGYAGGAYHECRLCNNKRKAEAGKRLRLDVLTHYSSGTPKCACCGETILEFLALDHINGGGQIHRKEIGSGHSLSRWLIRTGYPEGFQILCHNCNCAKGFYGQCPHQRNKEI